MEETVTIPKYAYDMILEQMDNYEKAFKIRYQKGMETKDKKRKDKYFVKVYKNEGRKLRRLKVLSKSEKALLFDIEPFINYETNLIVNEIGVPMKQENIGKLCGLGKSQTSDLLVNLVSKGILFEVKDGKFKYYGINHKYYECGNWDKSKIDSAFSKFQSGLQELPKDL